MRAVILSLATAGLLQACAPTSITTTLPGEPVPVPVTNACGAAALQILLGQPVTVLPDRGQWTTLRVISPGQAITMDFSATRLNAEVDASGRMTRLFCG